MEDTQNTQEMQTNSTVIDSDIDGVKSGGGKPPVETPTKHEAPRKTESARESLEAEAKKIAESPNEDDEDKPSKEDTKAEDKKPVKADKVEESARKVDASEQEAKTQKPPEGRRIIEAPARFLPRSRELWKNVPREVQEEWARGETERVAELSSYQESRKFHEELSDYDRMAKANNTSIKASLDNYTAIERKFSEDPAQGFRAIMQNMNFSPPQAISHILRAFNVTPQQLAEHIQRDPSAYTALAPQRQMQQQFQPQTQQQQANPEVKQLQEQLAAIQAQLVHDSVVTPFAKEYPEYHDYEDEIYKVLESGIIEQLHGNGLSPRDKLEAALLFAAPHLTKRGQKAEAQENDSVQSGQDEAPVQLVQGGKSVRSSVGGVTETSEPERKMSMRDMLEEEARKIARRA